MPLGSITSSTTVYATNIPSVPGFNDIRSSLRDLLETGYGAQLTGNDVSAGDLITAAPWTALANDLQRIVVHQSGNTQTFATGFPQTGGILYTNLAHTITSTLGLAYDNSTTVALSQLGSDDSGGASSRTTVWGSTITHQITYAWTNNNQARIFFNLGGYIRFLLGRTMPASPSSDDNTWNDLIGNYAIPRLNGFIYSYTEFTRADTNLYAQWNGTNMNWSTDSSSFVAKDINNNAVKISAVRSGGNLVITLTLEPISGSSINLDVVSIITNFYSKGDVSVAGFSGIAAPRPAVTVNSQLSGGGTVIVPPPPTKILSVNSLSPFSFTQGTNSTGQTVTLTNNGTSALTVTGITFSSNGVTAVPNYATFGSFPKTIPASGNLSFTVAYTGNTIGTFNNSFTILSNNDSGPVTVQTQQAVSAPAFNFTLSPSSWTVSSTTPDIISQKFVLVPNDGTIIGTGYLSSFTPTLGFTSSATSDGPTISFNPNSVTTNTTYSTVLSVSYGSVTKSANISVTRNLPTTFHLGSWVSAIQNNNAVVGMSYDSIAGQRYLTIGFSMGEDGSLSSASDLGYSSFISTSTLSTGADTGYSYGIVAYEMQNSSNHVQFIKDYGVWPRSNTNEPINTYISRSYKIVAPSAGTYTWRMSLDNEGYFTIDGQTIGDLRGYGAPYTYVTEDTFGMTAGEHTLTYYVLNASGGSDNPGGIALQILRTADSLEIWNTQMAVRSTPAYRYWREVYRMPINVNGTAQTLQSNDWIIKNSNGAYENNYGYYFGAVGAANYKSMFTVQNDGTGLLSITFNSHSRIPSNTLYNTDVTQFTYLPYYYNAITGSRVTQLESGPIGDGNQTSYFLGFNSNGSVRTNLQPYPRGSTGGGGGGGGCPDPETPILMSDFSSKLAGMILVGDLVIGINENTGEVGTYKINAKAVDAQPRIRITFTDNSSIVVSDTHKFLIYESGWKQVHSLLVGEKIQTIRASKPYKEISAFESLGIGPVVKLEVDQVHTYVADSLVSHNIKVIDDQDNGIDESLQ